MRASENRRVQVTKKMLKDALLEMLETKDISKISIRELCENANINRSTFYQHYGSQYDLLTDIENDFLNVISIELKKKTNVNNNIDTILTYISDHIALCRILINNKADENFKERLLGLPAIMDNFNAGFPEIDQTDGSYIRKFVFFGGYNMVVHWINTGCKESPQQIAKIITEIVAKIFS